MFVSAWRKKKATQPPFTAGGDNWRGKLKTDLESLESTLRRRNR